MSKVIAKEKIFENIFSLKSDNFLCGLVVLDDFENKNLRRSKKNYKDRKIFGE